MAADDFDVEYWVDEIKEMNDALERLGKTAFEIPDFNIEPLRKMKLPEHLTPEWDLSWGSFATIRLLNSPDLEEDGFYIHLSLSNWAYIRLQEGERIRGKRISVVRR